MNRTTRFMVEIITEDRFVDDNEKNEMAQKIADALVNECRSGNGITPEDSDAFPLTIYVKEWYSDKQIIEHP